MEPAKGQHIPSQSPACYSAQTPTYYVTDTHPLYWSLCATHRLSMRVATIFDEAAQGIHTIYVPALVVVELLMVTERCFDTRSQSEFLEVLNSLKIGGNYLFLPLMPETVIASAALADIPDMFDRLIAAEARRLRAPLISCDETISASGLVDVTWD